LLTNHTDNPLRREAGVKLRIL